MEYGYLSRESVEHIDKIVAALSKDNLRDEDVRNLGFKLISSYTSFLAFYEYEVVCERVEELIELHEKNKERLKGLMASIFEFSTARNYCMKFEMNTFSRRIKFEKLGRGKYDLTLRESTALTTNGYRLSGIFWLSSGLIENRGLPIELGVGNITESLFYIFEEYDVDLDELLGDTYEYIAKNNHKRRWSVK